jgi:two-component system, OmpR family, KDP operon response regulator KdpE
MKPRKILIVDDDVMLILALKRRLKAAGYAIVYALTAVSALEAALDESPDLILLDLGMALRDGFWVLERLRGHATTAATPIIVLTGWDGDDTRKRAFEAGATEFLQKPVEEKVLLASIARALEHESSVVANGSV